MIMPEIEAKEVTVGKLFGPDFIFEIPIYQRPLSWARDNFDVLFEDIYDALTSKEHQYFLGSIILQEHENAKSRYDIVDGQQRLSALAILMAVIRDRTNNAELKNNLETYLYHKEDKFKNIPAVMSISPWKDLREIFTKYIYEDGGTKKYVDEIDKKHIKYTDSQDPLYHLYEAITVFNEKLDQKFPANGQIENYVIYLLNNVYLVYIKATAFASAYRLFNVLNTRGIPLNTSDLLKSENIGEIKDAAIRVQYSNVWREIENKIGRDELEDLIAIIRTILLKEKAKVNIYEEYRKLIFDKHVKKGKEFIDYLKEMSDIYSDKVLDADIGDTNSRKNEYKNILIMMEKNVPFIDWVPPILAFYKKFKADKQMLDFLLRLEKKVVIEWMAGFSTTERTTSLNRLLKLISEEDDAQKVIDRLLYYKVEEVVPGRAARSIDYTKNDSVESELNRVLNDSQFYSIYGGKLARYILLRVDQNMWEMENFAGYPGTITVEHILPQSPEKTSDWITLFNENERKEWTHKLGNLVLLSGMKNSKAQNFEFAKKKEAYFKGKCTSFKITQELEKTDKWTKTEAEARHKKIVQDAKNIFMGY